MGLQAASGQAQLLQPGSALPLQLLNLGQNLLRLRPLAGNRRQGDAPGKAPQPLVVLLQLRVAGKQLFLAGGRLLAGLLPPPLQDARRRLYSSGGIHGLSSGVLLHQPPDFLQIKGGLRRLRCCFLAPAPNRGLGAAFHLRNRFVGGAHPLFLPAV